MSLQEGMIMARVLSDIALVALMVALCATTAFASNLGRESASQRGNDVVFSFDVDGSRNETVNIELTLTINGREYSAQNLHLSGDIGQVKAGKGKKITWDVLKDFPGGISGNVDWSLSLREKIAGQAVLIKGTCFGMGDAQGDPGADNKLVHKVCVSDFYVHKAEVTVGEFRDFVKASKYRTDAEKGAGCFSFTGDTWTLDAKKNWQDPGYQQEDDFPVVCVSWNDAAAFVEWLSDKSGKRHRLLTEAEWEYVARSGGKEDKWSGTGDRTGLNSVAWFGDNSRKRVNDVGLKKPNLLGIFDMSGNVWEWVSDWYADNYYNFSQSDNPGGPEEGLMKVMRGGSWFDEAEKATTTYRFRGNPTFASTNIGFRCARDKN